jgi:hypothetical protein
MHATAGLRKISLAWIIGIAALMTGCATVPMASVEQDAAAKTFAAPTAEKSGVYVFRDSHFGAALKKLVSIDGKPLGQSAPMTYFYKEIAPGPHTVSTESEFGDNTLNFVAEGGKNHYIRNYIRMGVFIGGANLEVVSEEEGKNAIKQCMRATAFNQ